MESGDEGDQSVCEGWLFGLRWLLIRNESRKILKGNLLSWSSYSDIYKVRKFFFFFDEESSLLAKISDYFWLMVILDELNVTNWLSNGVLIFVKGGTNCRNNRSVTHKHIYTQIHCKVAELHGWLCFRLFFFLLFYPGAQRVQEN